MERLGTRRNAVGGISPRSSMAPSGGKTTRTSSRQCTGWNTDRAFRAVSPPTGTALLDRSAAARRPQSRTQYRTRSV